MTNEDKSDKQPNKIKMCMSCAKRPATIKLSQKNGGQNKEVWICDTCYNAIKEKLNGLMSILPAALSGDVPPLPIERVLSNDRIPDFVKQSLSLDDKIKSNMKVPDIALVLPASRLACRCKYCGTSVEDFLTQKFPSCSLCFMEFEKDIQEFVNSLKIKNAPATKKKILSKKRDMSKSLDDKIIGLEKNKQQAIKEKDFGKAAQIRDEIKSLRDTIKKRTTVKKTTRKNSASKDSNK